MILSIGPYFNHSGQTGPAGPVEGTTYDPLGPSTGPSERFYDFVDGARLMERGYTFVMVDLRGFGGSSGCLDWGGPGEQADVVAAVKWAASQPWSTGSVGMYGKSYDGVTGLIGVNKRPAGLKAVVSQEPVYDLYRYLYGDGIRRVNSLLTPALYDLIDATPGPLGDTPTNPDYNVNGANDTMRPGCKAANWADQAGNDDHFSAYWRARTLIPGAAGSDVPLFLTQGLTENNTVADGTAQYLRNHTGYERAWLGPWEHVRGNETDESGRLKMGRAGWFDEVMRFYDRFLKGTEPAVADPQVAVQTNDGAWRAEEAWPPADAAEYTSALRTGTYTDDGTAERDRLERHEGRLDDLAAAALRRAPVGLREGDRRRLDRAAEREPRRRRLRPRRERPRPADHPPGPPDPLERPDRARPVVGRLEAAARPPDRRPRVRRQRRLVAARADQADRDRARRLDHAAVPQPGADADDRRRPGHAARSLPRRARHRAGGDAPERAVAGLRASAADDSVAKTSARGDANRHGRRLA